MSSTIPDQVSVTRLAEYLRDDPHHLIAINKILIEERPDGEWPRQFGLETVGDLRDFGREAFKAQFPEVDDPAVDWLFDNIKRKPGRPRKAA